jgi:hypothetical protein
LLAIGTDLELVEVVLSVVFTSHARLQSHGCGKLGPAMAAVTAPGVGVLVLVLVLVPPPADDTVLLEYTFASRPFRPP